MGFQVVSANPRLVWMPVDYGSAGDTLYVGQLVKSTSDGVAPLGAASGAYDTTGEASVLGVVVGTNNLNPVYNSTYKAEYITSVSSQAALAAREFRMVEGPFGKGDSQAMVQVAIITPDTYVKGQFFNSTFGTAPTAVVCKTQSTTGLGVAYTAGQADAASVADNSTLCGRTGANSGIYRIRTDATNSAAVTAVAFPNDVQVGDTFGAINCRPIGLSKVQTDTESMFFDSSAALSADYWGIDVISLDLSEAGKESVVFKFNGTHFDAY